MAIPTLYDEINHDKMSYVKVAVSIQLAVMVFGSIGLNLYWFMLMISTVMRALKRLGAGDEDEKPKENIEKTKLVKPGELKSDDLHYGSDATDDSEQGKKDVRKSSNGMLIR